VFVEESLVAAAVKEEGCRLAAALHQGPDGGQLGWAWCLIGIDRGDTVLPWHLC